MKNSALLLTLWLLVLSAAGGCAVNRTLVAEREPAMQEISYTTADQATIYGSWMLPPVTGKAAIKSPVVVLLHDYGLDRRDWGIFIPDLVQQGYKVLALDLRGHGKSIGKGGRVAGQYSPAVATALLPAGAADVQGALDWIRQQPAIDPKQISLIGVGLGADVAYACAKQFGPAIRHTIVISPSMAALTESDLGAAVPQRVLFCASSGDATGSAMLVVESLANFTRDPKKVVVYPSAVHGLAMFYRHPEIKQEILDWLRH